MVQHDDSSDYEDLPMGFEPITSVHMITLNPN